MNPCSTNSREYEFDSLWDETSDKDVDRIHTYKNQLKVGEKYRVWFDESGPTNIDVSSIDVIKIQKNSNISLDKVTLGLVLLVLAFFEYTMNTIEPTTFVLLTYPKLID